MRVKLSEIGGRSSAHDFRIPRQEMEKLDKSFDFDWMECHAELSKTDEVVLLVGRYSITLKTSCNRCLTSVELPLENEFELNLVSEANQVAPEGDLEISISIPDVDVYQNEEIFLSRYFEDQLLLDLPYTILCSEECEGMCSVCGANWNLTDCNCEQQTGNNPFSALKDLKLDS